MDARSVPQEYARLTARVRPGTHVRILHQSRGNLEQAKSYAVKWVREHYGVNGTVVSAFIDEFGDTPVYIIFVREEPDQVFPSDG